MITGKLPFYGHFPIIPKCKIVPLLYNAIDITILALNECTVY